MMSMLTRNQCLQALITRCGGYHLKNKKDKTNILNEYCRITGQNRKAVSAKIRSGKYILSLRRKRGEERHRRSSPYTSEVTAYLIKLWEIFDRPCGQRLAPMIKIELPRLVSFGELTISNEMIAKLSRVSARTIDSKLKPHKEKERLKRRYQSNQYPLLYEKIPIKLASDQRRDIGASIQADLVEHCGQSTEGQFIATVSLTDIGSGWWEGEPVRSRNGWSVEQALGRAQFRFPFPWQEVHSDNGAEFINQIVWRYTKRAGLGFSRSRPYMKNDNCFVEQKNSTHVRRIVGYRRYDSQAEYDILKTLYRTDLRLYKNFFQPIIPLVAKERIGGHIRRTYGQPKTPYQRILDDSKIKQTVKKQLTAIYQKLNPAELKRNISNLQNRLYRVYELKQKQTATTPAITAKNFKKLTPRSATFLFAEPTAFRP